MEKISQISIINMKEINRIVVKILALVIVTVSLQGCSGQMNKQGGGTLIGGITGGLLGSQFGKGGGKLAATGLGVLAGALVGGEIGKSLDEYDKQMLAKTSQQALETSPSGSTLEWRNPDSGNHGTVTPTKVYKHEGRYCREYIQEIFIGGERKKAYGTACRQPDGTWEIVK